MNDTADKKVAISLLMESQGERYWNNTVKERLAKVKAMIEWLKLRLPLF